MLLLLLLLLLLLPPTDGPLQDSLAHCCHACPLVHLIRGALQRERVHEVRCRLPAAMALDRVTCCECVIRVKCRLTVCRSICWHQGVQSCVFGAQRIRSQPRSCPVHVVLLQASYEQLLLLLFQHPPLPCMVFAVALLYSYCLTCTFALLWSCRASYEQLLLKYKVDLVFSGHTHAYERTKPIANYQVGIYMYSCSGCGEKPPWPLPVLIAAI
jgi:hypothetical protein